MAEKPARRAALDRLLAFVPYRQWVLVVPKRLRYFINQNPALAGELSKIFAREMIHYYGAPAPRSPLRPVVVARVEKEAALLVSKEKTDKPKKKANLWAACLARIFKVYPLICPKCKLEMKPVAVILADKELVRLLTHRGLPAEYPKFRPAPQASLFEHACGPPYEDCQPDPKGDLYEIIEPSPADD